MRMRMKNKEERMKTTTATVE